MNTIVIDADKCLQDGICVQACPFGVFTQTEDGTATVVQGAEAACINCGHCIALCPGAAITVNGMGSEDCEPVRKELQVSREQAVQLFRSRRSIRAYKDKSVDKGILEELLDMSRWAPTAKNVQPVHWIVLRQARDIADLSQMVIDWMRMKNIQPNVVKVFDQGKDIIHRKAPCLLVAHASSSGIKPVADCAIAAATVEAAAPAFGLGACWAGFFMSAANEHQPIINQLGLPQGHEAYAALMLGYPKFTYRRIPPREKLKVEWR
jgi:nitroreductase/NAD-dependent dihydropyrimidine dehydrogenase PreA subunit